MSEISFELTDTDLSIKGKRMYLKEGKYRSELCNYLHIKNRRYLGNKFKLLPFITRIIDNECGNIRSVADIFAGTGAYSFAFYNKRIITNDLMYSNYICNFAWFGDVTYDPEIVSEMINYYNSLAVFEQNYMTETFADTYFSRENCSKIGYIREDIEKRTLQGDINCRERALLITSLLYAMDSIANTCGHYDAFRKKSDFNKPLKLFIPEAKINNQGNNCFNCDANELVKRINTELVYIDPPYNSRQYCDAYHLLENVARWEKPQVYGVARKMDRSDLKSKYCTKEAPVFFKELVNDINARFILVSYNNMAEKGNDRSNAKISDEDLINSLEAKGEVKIFSKEYRPFSTGKSNISQHEERVFLCKVSE